MSSGRTLLFLEDDKDLQSLVGTFLREKGYPEELLVWVNQLFPAPALPPTPPPEALEEAEEVNVEADDLAVGGRRLVAVKPDRQPVGRHHIRQPFTTVDVRYKPGTTFYLFSDGFTDQFGGQRDRKFMRKPFQNLLVDSAALEPAAQRERLLMTLEEWRSGSEQTDDITVLGLRL